MKIVLVPLLALAGLATAGLVVGRFAERPETSVDCALPRHAWLPACLEAGPRPAAEPAATGSVEAAARRSTLPSEKPPPEPEPERAEASALETAPEQDGSQLAATAPLPPRRPLSFGLEPLPDDEAPPQSQPRRAETVERPPAPEAQPRESARRIEPPERPAVRSARPEPAAAPVRREPARAQRSEPAPPIRSAERPRRTEGQQTAAFPPGFLETLRHHNRAHGQ